MIISKRQACFLLFICLIANKLQRLPNFIATNVHRNGYFVFLILGAIDVLFMFLALYVNKKSKGRNIYEICNRAGGKVFAKSIMVLLALFFFISALIPYESIHNLFAYVLFDHLSWEIYSILLIMGVFFVASRGLKNLGRITEIFFYIMFVSLILLLILGSTTTHFERILPLYDINFRKILLTCFDYGIWFGDFFIVYMFIGNIKQEEKVGSRFLLTQIAGVLIVAFAYVVFYGLYENLAPNQGSLISSISQFALLDLDIGRVDWVLVLMFEISTFISSATFVYMSAKCLKDIFGSRTITYILIPLAVLMYVIDIALFKSVQVGAGVLSYVTRYFYPVIVVLVPISVLVASIVANKKDKKDQIKNGVERFNSLKRKIEPLDVRVIERNREFSYAKLKSKEKTL